MEARDHGISVDDRESAEWARFAAFGTQLVAVHQRLRDMLDDLQDGVVLSCVGFCAALTAHHTQEDREVFPLLAAKHPELRDFLGQLRRDHEVIAAMLREEPLDLGALTAVLRTHFAGEEKRLVDVLNSSVGLTPLTSALEFE
ncbi:hemerythrin domain-containing protein [Symbioplanes lichenis]|uniref:hemerythrin domain-containing protein n=1 Tax=Symbioplanes lichenis TaxID=1629072 RepID=UPI00273A2190|nr:hemerythrin domain-containing protein [Actinoplanes lichenis]